MSSNQLHRIWPHCLLKTTQVFSNSQWYILPLLSFKCPVVSDSLQPCVQHTRPPVLHHLLKFAQVHVHCISDAIQPSYSDALFSFCPQSFPESGTFPMSWLFPSGYPNTGVSASASVLPMSIQGWFPLRLIGLISLPSKGQSRVFSSTTVQRHRFFGALPSYSPALTTVGGHWQDHSLDYMDLFLAEWCLCFQHRVQVCHCFPAKKQSSSDFMAAVTIHSDFRA